MNISEEEEGKASSLKECRLNFNDTENDDSIDTSDEDYSKSKVKTMSEEEEERAKSGSDNFDMLRGANVKEIDRR